MVWIRWPSSSSRRTRSDRPKWARFKTEISSGTRPTGRRVIFRHCFHERFLEGTPTGILITGVRKNESVVYRGSTIIFAVPLWINVDLSNRKSIGAVSVRSVHFLSRVACNLGGGGG